jgi:D-alanine--poly(phosphoribitol) ligase subunit 1
MTETVNPDFLSTQWYFLDFLSSERESDSPAIYIGDRFYTYRELSERVLYAAKLISAPKFHQQHIAVYLTDEIETYAAILAIWYTGNIYLPIHPAYPPGRIQQMYQKSSFRGVFNAPEHLAGILPSEMHFWTVSEKGPSTEPEPLMHRYRPDEICYCLFTSGSTGVPKGVQINYRNLSSFLDSAERLGIRLEPGAGYLQMFEHTFDLSIVATIWPLMNLGTLYHVGAKGPKYSEVYRLLEEFNLSFAILVPSVLNMLRPYFNEIFLPGMKILGLCGEAAPADFADVSKKCWPNARFFNFYGPTECTIFCTAYEIPESGSLQKNGMMCIGTPVHHASFLISDENLVFAESFRKGILWIGGDQVMPGYLGQNDLTSERIKHMNGIPYYNTGDLVEVDDLGHLYFLGRLDQQVKINGYRIELSEIEFQSGQILSRPCVAIAIKDAKGFDQLILFVRGEVPGPSNEIRAQLGAGLPAYMIPEKIIFMNDFPLNANGKLDRNALRQQYEANLHQAGRI